MLHTVTVAQMSFEGQRNDFHILVGMGLKSRSRGNRIIIQYPQGSEMNACRVVILVETKGMIAVKPIQECVASRGSPVKYCVHKLKDLSGSCPQLIKGDCPFSSHHRGHQMTGTGVITEFTKVNPLPGTEVETASRDGNINTGTGEHRLGMGGHVIITL